MIIWGFRGRVKLLATLRLSCGSCGSVAAHHLVLLRRWFTLFFIPVIPYSTKRFSQCTMCGVESRLTQEDAERLIGSAPAPAPPAPTPVDAAPAATARPLELVPCQFCGVENDVTVDRCGSCGRRSRPMHAVGS